ncbi:MAG: sensor histidine kinase [Mangrovibacterium sp.]
MENEVKDKVLPKTKLILLSSSAITILFSLPRIAVLFRMEQANLNLDYRLTDFLARTIYCFIVAFLFFHVNLASRKIRIGPVSIDMASLWHRMVVNVVLLVVVGFFLIKVHLLLFDPLSGERFFRFLFNITLILEVILTALIAQIYRQFFRNYQMKMTNEQLLKANVESSYEALKSQVNPHFLFNSFNTLSSMILSDQNKAVEYVNNMSDVFRYVLESSKKDRVTVEEEIRFIGAYSQMLKGRYGEKLQFEIRIASESQLFLLPPMAVQILIENAVKHNVISKSRNLYISVFAEGPELIVTNNLQEKKVKEPSTGLGLYNLNHRCRYMTRKELVVKRNENDFSVTIPLMANENINY